jgi:hypothetical protein
MLTCVTTERASVLQIETSDVANLQGAVQPRQCRPLVTVVSTPGLGAPLAITAFAGDNLNLERGWLQRTHVGALPLGTVMAVVKQYQLSNYVVRPGVRCMIARACWLGTIPAAFYLVRTGPLL